MCHFFSSLSIIHWELSSIMISLKGRGFDFSQYLAKRSVVDKRKWLITVLSNIGNLFITMYNNVSSAEGDATFLVNSPNNWNILFQRDLKDLQFQKVCKSDLVFSAE